jgi:transcriptional regulator with XRE-family HTH domain
VNGLLITERRVAAGLTIRLLAERLGVESYGRNLWMSPSHENAAYLPS